MKLLLLCVALVAIAALVIWLELDARAWLRYEKACWEKR